MTLLQKSAADLDERIRLKALDTLQILDTPPEDSFDDLAWLAGMVCDVPMSLVSFVDAERQWFKARCGFDLQSMARKDGFCTHALDQDDILEVEDARLDERFAHLPAVVGKAKVRFYAGVVLHSVDGQRLGTLCVLDTRPRVLTERQREALRRLSRRASETLEMRRKKLLAQSREAAIAQLLDVLPDGVVTCDENGNLKEFNATSRDWHGVDVRACAPEEWASHFGLYDEKNQRLLAPQEIPLARAWNGEKVRNQPIVIRTPCQSDRTVNCNANPLVSPEGNVLGAVCTMHDVTVQTQFSQLMERMALTDELTGLPNRAAWFSELDRVVARSKRSGQTVAVMFIDLNRFKFINDTYGHAAGDEVLKQFSARLKSACRQGDFMARLSGDEFVVCLSDIGPEPVDPDRIARKIHEAMDQGISWENEMLHVGCSIGFAFQNGADVNAALLMEKADKAMYVAKRDKALPFFALN